MALKTLSSTGISNGNIILPGQVTQSVDAFTGTEGYAITVSGSFTFSGATTGSGVFTEAINATTAVNASKLNPTLNASTNANYNVLFAATSSAAYETIYKEDGNVMTYNPSTNVLAVTSSQAVSSSQAISASYADNAKVLGSYYPSGGALTPNTSLNFLTGASKTGNPTPTVAISISSLIGKTLGQTCFVTATVSGSGTQSIVVNSLVGGVLTFETQNPNTNFYYTILYI